MGIAIKIGLGPLLLAQGLLVKRRALRLPEPAGPRMGSTGEGPTLRLLVLGDSAAAGVGVAHQSDALLGQLVARLADGYRVDWTLHARTGATTAATLQSLNKLAPAAFDVVVTSLGVNDVTAGRSRAAFLADQRELIARLKSDFGARLIVISGFPPVHRFPLLPQPLRWYLGQQAKHFDRDLEAAMASDPSCIFYRQPSDGPLDMMASDGFHPGAAVYARWAGLVADLVKTPIRTVGLKRVQ